MDKQPHWATPKLIALWQLLNAAEHTAAKEQSPGTLALIGIMKSTYWMDMLDAVTDPKLSVLVNTQPEQPPAQTNEAPMLDPFYEDLQDRTQTVPTYTRGHVTLDDDRPWSGRGTPGKAYHRHYLVRRALTAAYRRDRNLPETQRGWMTMRELKRQRGISTTLKTNSIIQTLLEWEHLDRMSTSPADAKRPTYKYRLKPDYHTDKKEQTQ